MVKLSKEQPKQEVATPFDIETRISKEEQLNPDKFSIEEWDALMMALRLLSKDSSHDSNTGTLEIKNDSLTGKELAIVYRNSDHTPVFTTEDGSKIFYLKNPDMMLKQFELNRQEGRETDKLVKHIGSGGAETDKES